MANDAELKPFYPFPRGAPQEPERLHTLHAPLAGDRGSVTTKGEAG
jgi:hypothetical protein